MIASAMIAFRQASHRFQSFCDTAKSELPGLKPHRFYSVYVVPKATTHKYCVVATQTTKTVRILGLARAEKPKD